MKTDPADICSVVAPGTMIDAEERARLYPETFKIPPLEERICGEVGFFARIGFDHPDGGERFWVQVVEVLENGQYVGRVDNEIDSEVWGVAYNDLLIFEPRHIMDCR